MNKNILANLLPDELENSVLSLGFEKYRAKQIFHSLNNLNESLKGLKPEQKKILKERFLFPEAVIEEVFHSKLDSTKKALIKFPDGNMVESVFMRYDFGNSCCISTQVGCRMGCVFCASGKNGLVRNLEPYEMLSQVRLLEQFGKISHIVLMGSGEPLDNYENVLRFIKLISHESGKNLSLRNITLSTSGLPDKIKMLADETLPIGLSLSLHNADQKKREEIMPIAKAHSLEEVKKALLYYQSKNNRRITFEYTLIANENDSKKDAENIKNFAKGLKCHINLIKLNPIEEYNKKSTDLQTASHFQKLLDKRGLNATIRRTLGADISASCGQLRNRKLLAVCNRK